MRRPGFTGRGFYQDKLMLGPGGADLTISAPTCVFGAVLGSTNLYSSPQDIIARNITINSQLFPTHKASGRYYPLKIISNGTVSLNAGGLVRSGGDVCANGGVWSFGSGNTGYISPFFNNTGNNLGGTVGGSGRGGAAAVSGSGTAGEPYTVQAETLIYWGGSGGTGKKNGTSSSLGGEGGQCSPDFGTCNAFQPSIYLDGIIYTNIDSNSFPKSLFPYRLCGGGGGGGASDDVSGTGGGAAGGGVCWITADKLVMNGGSVDCNGGYTNTGGGGGGGGLVIINAGERDWASNSSTIFCSGGASDGGGTGSDGTVLIFSNDLVAKFTGNVTKTIYDAAVLAFNSTSLPVT
jgi:hypothetical protein